MGRGRDALRRQTMRRHRSLVLSARDDASKTAAMYDLAKAGLKLGVRPTTVLTEIVTCFPGAGFPTLQIVRAAAEDLGMGRVL